MAIIKYNFKRNPAPVPIVQASVHEKQVKQRQTVNDETAISNAKVADIVVGVLALLGAAVYVGMKYNSSSSNFINNYFNNRTCDNCYNVKMLNVTNGNFANLSNVNIANVTNTELHNINNSSFANMDGESFIGGEISSGLDCEFPTDYDNIHLDFKSNGWTPIMDTLTSYTLVNSTLNALSNVNGAVGESVVNAFTTTAKVVAVTSAIFSVGFFSLFRALTEGSELY